MCFKLREQVGQIVLFSEKITSWWYKISILQVPTSSSPSHSVQFFLGQPSLRIYQPPVNLGATSWKTWKTWQQKLLVPPPSPRNLCSCNTQSWFAWILNATDVPLAFFAKSSVYMSYFSMCPVWWNRFSAITTSWLFIYCTWRCKLLWIPWKEDWVTADMINWFFIRYSLNNDVGDQYLSTVAYESISLLNQLHRRSSRGFLLCSESGKQIKLKDRWDKHHDLMGLLPTARIARLRRLWEDKRIDKV